MKTYIKNFVLWIGLSILMTIFWIIGLVIGTQIFPSEMMESASESDAGLFILFVTCFLNTGALLYFIRNSVLKGWKLAGAVFVLGFGLMHFMAQIETLWFNESVQFPIRGILSFVTGGAIMFLLFSITATWLTGNFRKKEAIKFSSSKIEFKLLWKRILLLAVIIWPLLYFIAGYLIAWQFEAVRVYYSGSPQKESFFVMLFDNLASPLYLFQILRGFLWVLLSMIVLKYIKGSTFKKGIALVLLLVLLCCSQLLIPNPLMPEAVRIAHLIETSIENAIWGIFIVWILEGSTTPEGSPTSMVLG